MGVFSNKIQRDELKAGDHIYSWRHVYLYAHHGIYMGEGKVIHFTRGSGLGIGTRTILDHFIFNSSPSNSLDNPCPRFGNQSSLDGVVSSCLECFLCSGDLYLFEYGVNQAFFIAKAQGGSCTLAPSDPNQDVLHRASYLLEMGFGVYDLLKNNCEDFAIYCKMGLLVYTSISVGRSGQAAPFLAATSAIISSPLRFLTTCFFELTAMACGRYCHSRLVFDMGVHCNVTKFPVERLVARSDIEHEAISKAIKEGLENGALNGVEKDASFWSSLQGEGKAHGIFGSSRFELYNVDFGWRKPLKVDVISIDSTEAMGVMDSRNGDGGVKIGIVLNKHHFEAFVYVFA